MTYSDDIRKLLEITDPNITFIEGCLDQDSITFIKVNLKIPICLT